MQNIQYFIILSVLFLLLFLVAEILYRRLGVKVERTRKLVHIGTGLLTLLFPLMLDSQWEVFVLCFVFTILLIISQQTNLLPSINEIKRLSYGSLAFPIAVWICFFIYKYLSNQTNNEFNSRLYFYLPILIMSVADPIAALVGRLYPVKKYSVYGGRKSIMGSITFFLVAFTISILLLYYFNFSGSPILLIAFIIALVTAIVEGITPLGMDNLTIPLAVLLLLHYSIS